MNIKEVLSDFQFQESRIVKLEIKNDFVNKPKASDLETSIKLGNPSLKVFKKEDILNGILQLAIDITDKQKEDGMGISVSIVLEGLFTYTHDNEDQFNQMLLINGNTTLYSIARSIILTTTTLALSSGKVVLPMINFVELIKRKSEEDTKQ